ncbi:MAG: DUF2079 domain-containing protein [Thermoplasmata archaeon]
MALIDAVVLSWVQVRAYDVYYTFSQDFGSFNQSFYTTLFDHRLFYYTANLPAGTQGTYFAVHFAPLLFLLLPFYALAPAPTTLLVIKEVTLALGAFPVFGIARRRLGSPRWGFAFGVAYLLSPLTMTLDWISFDMEVFLPFLVLSAFYFLTVERRLPFFVFWTLALATIETIAPLLALCAFIALLGSIWGSRLKPSQHRPEERRFWIGGLALSLGWYLAAYIALHTLSPNGGTFGSAYAAHYTTLGATSFLDVVPQALLHPDLAGAALVYGGSTKVLYVLLLFGCLAFLPLFGEARYYLPVLAWLVLGLFSNFPPMYSLGSQYLGYVTPFLFAGAIGGACYVRSWIGPETSTPEVAVAPAASFRKKWNLPGADQAILPFSFGLAVLVALVVANPLTTQPVAGLTSLQYGVPSPDSHTKLLDRTIGLIPNHAAVLTTAHLFPQVSSRLDAYVLPTSQLFAGGNTYWGSLDQFVNESSYVLFDFTSDLFVSELILYFGNFSGFGTVVDSDGVFLLERGWSGPPLPAFWSGSTSSYTGASLNVGGGPAAVIPSNHTLYYFDNGAANGTFFSRGPNINYVLPGIYNVTVDFSLRATKAGSPFSYQLKWIPINVTATKYINTSAGHHYEYGFVRETPVLLASVNVPAKKGAWVTESESFVATVTGLGSLEAIAQTFHSNFYVYIIDLTISLVGPPPYLGPGA